MSADASAMSGSGIPQQIPGKLDVLRTALLRSQITIAQLDAQRRYVWVINPPSPLSESAMRDKTDVELFGDAALPLAQVQAQVLSEGVALGTQLQLLIDGSVRRFELFVQPLAVDTEVTSLLQLSIELATESVPTTTDEIGEASEEKRQLLQLQIRLAANARFAATVAHEVNTPLQAIESSLHLAGKATDPEQREAYLRQSRNEIQRIGAILRQLIEFYRPREAPAGFDVNQVIERVLVLIGGSLRRAGIALVRELAPALPPIQGSAEALVQVLLNLIVNGMQAMPRGGGLTLRSELRQQPDGSHVIVVTVSDEGSGVDPALYERIFEPFFTTRPDGTGLGLSVSQQLVEEHGGKIKLVSAPGAGARFEVELPVQ